MLIWARSIQGLGAALLVPGSLALITSSFPEETRRAGELARGPAFSAITAAIGPVIGGLADRILHMALGLFPESPARLGSHPCCLPRLPESRNEKASHHLDWPGALLATLGLGGRHVRAN